MCSNFSHCERFCYLYIRIRKTGELLTNIRTLKMYGWDNWFANWLKETRANEVTHLAVWFSTFRNINFLYLQELCIKSYVFVWLLQTRKYLDAWCVFFWATTPTLFSLCTFGLYALMGHQLDAATVLFESFSITSSYFKYVKKKFFTILILELFFFFFSGFYLSRFV